MLSKLVLLKCITDGGLVAKPLAVYGIMVWYYGDVCGIVEPNYMLMTFMVLWNHISNRYVDDVHGIVESNYIEEFHQYLNTICNSIKFTREEEHEGSLVFVDVLVTRIP